MIQASLAYARIARAAGFFAARRQRGNHSKLHLRKKMLCSRHARRVKRPGQHGHIPERTPYPRVRAPEQDHGRNTDCRGQVRNTAVVADVQTGATRQSVAKFAQRRSDQQFSGDVKRAQGFSARIEQLQISLAKRQHHTTVSKTPPRGCELRKDPYRPVFGAPPAAGMQPENGCRPRRAGSIDQVRMPQQLGRRYESCGVEKASSTVRRACRTRIMPDYGNGPESSQSPLEGRVPGKKEVDPSVFDPGAQGRRDGTIRRIKGGRCMTVNVQECIYRQVRRQQAAIGGPGRQDQRAPGPSQGPEQGKRQQEIPERTPANHNFPDG